MEVVNGTLKTAIAILSMTQTFEDTEQYIPPPEELDPVNLQQHLREPCT